MINHNYKGVIIEESLEDNSIIKRLKVLKTRVENVIDKHKTPWIKQWTLYSPNASSIFSK